MTGLFIYATFTSETRKRIEDYLRYHSILPYLETPELHSTIYLSTNEKDLTQYIDSPQYKVVKESISPCDYCLDLFGGNNEVLVIKLNSKYLVERHNFYKNVVKLDQEYTEFGYNPHISLSYDFNISDLSYLKPPSFPIEITGEYCEPRLEL